MTVPQECRIEPALVAALYVKHADELRAFLLGVLRDSHLAADVLQATFVKALEQGHAAQEETLKGWLFQVAYREALAVRRRQGVDRRAAQRIAERSSEVTDVPSQASQALPHELAVRHETVQQVRAALYELSHPQQQVVQMRMQQNLKFREIAAILGEPLGTVLARMQAALKRLRERLEP